MNNQPKEDKVKYFQREDPEKRAYRWYKLTLSEAGDLFSESKVTIQRGRLGQNGETIERFFKTRSEAVQYFDTKVSERLKHGYEEVKEIKLPSDPDCSLCKLVQNASDQPSFIFEFKHTVLLLNWDQTYKGRSMLVFKTHIVDFFRLAPAELLASLSEIRQSEAALRKAFSPELMNYLFMGNRSGHVHVHLVPRYKDDPNFGSSPFLSTSRTEEPQLSENEYKALSEAIKAQISPS